MLISLCMIVKNEEKVLGRCLDSVQGLVDEIIIVDTGSQDRTKEIARQYTHHVYDFEWVDDFAAARNESLRHASGKWILVMDADEYVEPGQQDSLRQKLEHLKTNKPQCFLVKIMNFHGARGEQIYESTGARLFTNKRGIRYREPIHEQLVCSEGQIQFAMESFTLLHSGYTTETVIEKGKNERNMAILRSMATESKLQDPYFCFVLGNEYANGGKLEEAYDYYKKAMEKAPSNNAWYEHLLDRLCQTALKTGHFKEVQIYIQKGKSHWPQYADYHCLEGLLYEAFGFYDRALQSFRECLEIAERLQAKGERYWITEENYGKVIPHQMSAEIARRRGDLHQLVYHLTAVLKLDHNHYASLRTLLRTLALHEPAGSVITFIEKLYPRSNPKDAFVLFQTSLSEGLAEIADYYREACKNHRIPIAYEDELNFALLQRADKDPIGVQQGKLAPLSALFAGIVTRDNSYLALVEPSSEKLNSLYVKIINSLAIDSAQSDSVELDMEESAIIAQLLVRLLQFGYFEEYDHILQHFASVPLLELLVVQLRDLDYRDMAINLYSVILDNGQLSDGGLKQLAQCYFALGKPEEGLRYIEQALHIDPSIDLIGIAIENCGKEDISSFVSDYVQWLTKKEMPGFVEDLIRGAS